MFLFEVFQLLLSFDGGGALNIQYNLYCIRISACLFLGGLRPRERERDSIKREKRFSLLRNSSLEREMEGRKQTASSSSLTNELFGSKESSSSSGIFGSIFSPPSKVLGRESLRSESMEKKHDSSKEAWNTKPGAPGDASRSYETESQGTAYKDTGSMYQDQRVQPCHLSSSIYYGGQDVYSPRTPNSQGPGINSVVSKHLMH